MRAISTDYGRLPWVCFGLRLAQITNIKYLKGIYRDSCLQRVEKNDIQCQVEILWEYQRKSSWFGNESIFGFEGKNTFPFGHEKDSFLKHEEPVTSEWIVINETANCKTNLIRSWKDISTDKLESRQNQIVIKING